MERNTGLMVDTGAIKTPDRIIDDSTAGRFFLPAKHEAGHELELGGAEEIVAMSALERRIKADQLPKWVAELLGGLVPDARVSLYDGSGTGYGTLIEVTAPSGDALEGEYKLVYLDDQTSELVTRSIHLAGITLTTN